jgi:hypothetical protein
LIKIIDAIMGAGKSTWAFKYMYDNPDKKFIYITPYLTEIKRLIGEGTEDEPYTKWYHDRGFREPKHLGEGKLESLHYLLINDYNIATTHALFRMCTNETIDLINSGEYTLILDEALDVVDLYEVNRKDYEMLLQTNKIKVENRIVTWIDKDYDGKLSEWKTLCNSGVVIELKKSQKVQLLVWNFEIESFLTFKEIFVMTYLFESSYLKYYFDMYDVEYNKYSIDGFNIIKFEDKKPYNKESLRDLIHIYDGNLNNIGDKYTALSLNWFKKNKGLVEKLKKNIYNYIHNIANSKSEDIIWTTFKSEVKNIKGKGYSNSFIPLNTKATNLYRNCDTVVYCCNRFMSPDYVDYFGEYGLIVDQEIFALSEMIQFIWRSAIREEKPIKVYIPSSRMRNLLIDWLNDESL